MVAQRKKIILKSKIARRVERGHLWVFSNEVESIEGEPHPGDEVEIFSAKNKFIGMGLFSKSSLITARIYSRKRNLICDEDFISTRIRDALLYRKSLNLTSHSYRLIYSESDGLPGVIIDVFGEYVVFQITTYAMELRRDVLISALKKIISPEAIIERSDVPYRELEGLAKRNCVVSGDPANPCMVFDNNCKIYTDLINGQKTGYYLDQIKNRNLAIPFFKDKNILDLFCYVGSWSIVAGTNNAKSVIGVDSSEKALELARKSAIENNVDSKCTFIKSDVFSLLREFVNQKQKFDVIVIDPPALAKSKKDKKNALNAYRELNLRAMQILVDGGVLITCSCSHHISAQDFLDVLTMSAKDASADFIILHQSTQSPDHPIHLQTPETSYLKAFFLKKRMV